MDDDDRAFLDAEFVDAPDVHTEAGLRKLVERICWKNMGVDPSRRKDIFYEMLALGRRVIGYRFTPPTPAAMATVEDIAKRLGMIQRGLTDIESIPGWQTQWTGAHRDLVLARSRAMAELGIATAPQAAPAVTTCFRGAGSAPPQLPQCTTGYLPMPINPASVRL
jgi:hypothetical protein